MSFRIKEMKDSNGNSLTVYFRDVPYNERTKWFARGWAPASQWGKPSSLNKEFISVYTTDKYIYMLSSDTWRGI